MADSILLDNLNKEQLDINNKRCVIIISNMSNNLLKIGKQIKLNRYLRTKTVNQYPSWTIEELIFLQKNIQTMTYKEIGKVINRTPPAIQSKVRQLPFQKKIKKYPITIDFFKQWSSEMAYILGFIISDGNICKSGRAHLLQIASDDKDVIRKIKYQMCAKGPILTKSRPNGKISYQFRISDKTIFTDLIKLGITENKSLTISPPFIPNIYLRDFLRGFFDGDGSVYINKHRGKLVTEWCTASIKMAKFIHMNVSMVCPEYKGKIQKTLTPKKNRYYYGIVLSHRDSLLIFNYLYVGATIYMNRKYKKFLKGGAVHAGHI